MTTRESLLKAASELLEKCGVDAVTTRAVCAAVNVQAPTFYYHFGDKNGLLDALVAQGVEVFLARKGAQPATNDALADHLAGWDDFLSFTLDQPQLFRLMMQRASDNHKLVDAAMATTDTRLLRLAAEGRLRTDIKLARSALMAVANGVTMLATQGIDRHEIEEVGRFMQTIVLSALVESD
jgi:AcrR family transcriptional regulator